MSVSDAVFEALANETRRRLIVCLDDSDSATVDVSTLCSALGGDDETMVRLYHAHLPLLADRGFVRWTPSTNAVSPGPRFEDLTPVLSRVDDSVAENSLVED